jgi:hypothetical protein
VVMIMTIKMVVVAATVAMSTTMTMLTAISIRPTKNSRLQ